MGARGVGVQVGVTVRVYVEVEVAVNQVPVGVEEKVEVGKVPVGELVGVHEAQNVGVKVPVGVNVTWVAMGSQKLD